MSFKALLVLTSQKTLGDSGTAAGSWLEELAAPYYGLLDAGCSVELASVRGGNAPIDPASTEEPWLTDNGRRLMDDGPAMKRLQSTRAIKDVNCGEHDAVFLVGGAAVTWDFPSDPALGSVLRDAITSDKIVGGVCHGVSGFLNPAVVGEVSGKNMTCISNVEDEMAGFDKLVPMMPETPLKNAGASMSFASEPFGCHAVRDGNLVTGQNPASAAQCATLLLQALKERAAATAA